MRILLLTPPMTQLNTPYPATAYLTGFLRERGYDTVQADPAIELVVRVFSRSGLDQIYQQLEQFCENEPLSGQGQFADLQFFLDHKARYTTTIDAVIRFLQGKDPSLAMRITAEGFLPTGPRFRAINQFSELDPEDPDPLSWAFGSLGLVDRARYLATLYLDDIADIINRYIDPRFELSRYGEKLAASNHSFDALHEALHEPRTLIDQHVTEITKELFARYQPDVVGFTLPFPGNVYGALLMAQTLKSIQPQVVLVAGGGYVNTELRNLREPRLFDYFDFVTLDDGEAPLLAILERLKNFESSTELLRTFVREQGQVVLKSSSHLHDIPFIKSGTPTYDGLPLQSYLSICEMLNPMHRLWSDGRWNKLTLAHGCYWKGCNFCDITLDYISRYEEASADVLVDKMLKLIEETGQSGFHFVDEAAPPKVLLALSKRLIERNVVSSWWGNVRFEKTFTPKVATLMANAGCIAVSGGLEVASDRLLKLMNKGVTVAQVARVTKALTDAGILVHAYLMYGFPTQTTQETVDALERVRQLFEEGCIQSAFWHRFSATVHSPIGRNPKAFGIRALPMPEVVFAENDLDFEDPTPCDHDVLGRGLKKALYNYMLGIGLDLDVREWFDVRVPKTTVPVDLIASAID